MLAACRSSLALDMTSNSLCLSSVKGVPQEFSWLERDLAEAGLVVEWFAVEVAWVDSLHLTFLPGVGAGVSWDEEVGGGRCRGVVEALLLRPTLRDDFGQVEEVWS